MQQPYFHQHVQPEHQITEANVPQSSHVRVASANMNSISSYMIGSSNQGQSNLQHMQNEAVRKIAHLKKTQGNHSNVNIAAAVKKQFSQGDIAGFVQNQKQAYRIAGR